jgi:serine/threonine-protein kinase
MAPEQIKGNPIDRRVDIFALGIVLYALTTGKHPFRRESEAATMYNICAPQPVMPPRKVNPAYPPEVERIIVKALAKEPDKRYQTANEMLRDFDQLPSHLRASTDEEVAVFVKKLFASKRDERQAALAEALARADLVAKNRLTSPGFTMEPIRQSVHSAVSVMTGTGAMQMGEGSGAGMGTGVVTAVGFGSARKNLVVFAAIATGVFLVAAVALSMFIRKPINNGGAAGEARSSAVPSNAASASNPVKLPTDEALVPGHPEDNSANAIHSASPSNSEDSAGNSKQKPQNVVATTSTKTSTSSVTTPSVPKVTNTTKTTTTSTGNTQKWKHDPGF